MVETLHSQLRKHIFKRPNAPAFLIAAGDRSLPITWRQFGRDVAALSKRLMEVMNEIDALPKPKGDSPLAKAKRNGA